MRCYPSIFLEELKPSKSQSGYPVSQLGFEPNTSLSVYMHQILTCCLAEICSESSNIFILYLKHLPEWRRTTMMHVVASSDPRIFTFSVKETNFINTIKFQNLWIIKQHRNWRTWKINHSFLQPLHGSVLQFNTKRSHTQNVLLANLCFQEAKLKIRNNNSFTIYFPPFTITSTVQYI